MRHLLQRLPLLAVTVICLSCSNNNNKENLAAFQSLDEMLTFSNSVIASSNKSIYEALEQKTFYSAYSRMPGYYYDKAKDIRTMTKNTIAYIESIKRWLKRQAGFDSSNPATSEALNNVSIVNDLFVQQGRGKELYKTLQQYRSGILGLDSALAKEFNTKLVLTTAAFEQQSAVDFTTEFLHDIPVSNALYMLTKFQSRLYMAENNLFSYINNKCTINTDILTESYAAIITTTSSCVLPGQSIEVIAGIGSFSRATNPSCKINGRTIPFDPDNTVTKKIRAPQQPGNYSLPVELSFTNQDGKQMIIGKEIKYTVFNKDSIANP
ncbi:MAG: hypothetical protein QM764_04060 [Chitinophagaceae bacterium]